MTIPRLYVDAPLRATQAVEIDEARARYLGAVLRLEPGASVRLFNGRDGEWSATIVQVGKRGGALVVTEQMRAQRASPDLTVLFAPLKRHATDLIAEKATKLGVRSLQPTLTRRTVAETVRTDRLRSIVIEAAEQTERLDLPEVVEPQALMRRMEAWPERQPLLFADEAGDDERAPWGGERGRAPPLVDVLRSCSEPAMAILIGPEGGFDPDERLMLRSLPFVRPVSLGPRILRAETAAIAALAVAQSIWGDWGA